MTFNCKMVAIKKIKSPKKNRNMKGRTLHNIFHVAKKNVNGRTLHDILQEGLMRRMHVFNTLLCYSKFTHSCRVSERREGKRERQVMPPLVLLIKFIILLIIFQESFSFICWSPIGDFHRNLVAKYFFHSPWQPNGRSLDGWRNFPLFCT